MNRHQTGRRDQHRQARAGLADAPVQGDGAAAAAHGLNRHKPQPGRHDHHMGVGDQSHLRDVGGAGQVKQGEGQDRHSDQAERGPVQILVFPLERRARRAVHIRVPA